MANDRTASESDTVVEDSSSVSSHEDALCEMLGLTSMASIAAGWIDEENEKSSDRQSAWVLFRESLPYRDEVRKCVTEFQTEYSNRGVAVFDPSLSIPASFLRQSTEKLVWSKKSDDGTVTEPSSAQRTYERIGDQRCLTRLERFCDEEFPDWKSIADYAGTCLTLALGIPMVLFKEKLNLKPPGGSGFAPHLDTPSLMQLGETNDDELGPLPTEFVTVMVAIDDMTRQNGCLRVVHGPWTRENAVDTTLATDLTSDADNPDGGGRKGLIPAAVADKLAFEDVVVRGGTMVAFSGYTPHRSSMNGSPFPRRAVFFTYNLASQGDHRRAYYDRMMQLRDEYRAKNGLLSSQDGDALAEFEALKSIPRI